MALLARSSLFGPLNIFEVYEEYDGPRLFSCRTTTGSYFLALWTGETHDSDQYILLAVSPRRLEFIRAGEIQLRAAFLEPEDGQLGRLSVSRRDDVSAQYEVIPTRLVDTDLLPSSGERLAMPGEPLPLTQSSTPEASRALKREIVDLRFRSDKHDRQLSFSRMAKCLTAFQRLLSQTGKQLSLGKQNRTFRDFLKNTTLLDVLPGSLVIRLAFPHATGADEAELQQQLIKRTFESLRGENLDANIKAQRAIRKLATSLQDGVSLDIGWGSLNGAFETTALSKKDWTSVRTRRRLLSIYQIPEIAGEAEKLLPDLKAPGFEMGIFKVVDLKNQTFEIYVPGRKSWIRGKIGAKAVDKIERITLNKVYLVLVRSTGRQRQLIDLREAPSLPDGL
jgi:hypothetical protein